MTRKQRTIIRRAAKQVILWARWKAEMRELPKEERTDFDGPTGDEVIEAHTNGDGAKWARLATRALDLADTPSFKNRVSRGAALGNRRREG